MQIEILHESKLREKLQKIAVSWVLEMTTPPEIEELKKRSGVHITCRREIYRIIIEPSKVPADEIEAITQTLQNATPEISFEVFLS